MQPDLKTGPSINRGKSKQDYETPQDFFSAVVSRFGHIPWDLAATAENSKAFEFFTEETNSLIQPWHALDNRYLWLNPPFANIYPWAHKCWQESLAGAKILLLVPAGVGTNWFAECVYQKAVVHFIRPRMTFKGCPDPYPKDLLLCEYSPAKVLNYFQLWKWG